MSQRWLDNVVGLPVLWERIKKYVEDNRFSEAKFHVDTDTGMLVAEISGNIKFFIDEKGHLNSEVN